MKARAALDLDVGAASPVVKYLRAVHPQVVYARLWMFGVDQRQGQEGATVAGPTLERGQVSQLGLALANFGDRAGCALLEPHPGQGAEQSAAFPKARKAGWHEFLGEPRQVGDEFLGPRTEG